MPEYNRTFFILKKTIRYYEEFGQHAVAQLGEALCYKPEGPGFHSRWSLGVFH